MLSSFKTKTPSKEPDAVPNATDVLASMQRPVLEPVASEPEPTNAATESLSCIGSGMSIIGKVECDGPVRVFGRIEGELRASDLLIGNGAEVKGNIIAQDATICGRVEGTIRAVRVRLQCGGAVEGDIFHRSLSIDESSLFQGSSRRLENPTDLTSAVDLDSRQMPGASAFTPLPSVDADLPRLAPDADH